MKCSSDTASSLDFPLGNIVKISYCTIDVSQWNSLKTTILARAIEYYDRLATARIGVRGKATGHNQGNAMFKESLIMHKPGILFALSAQ